MKINLINKKFIQKIIPNKTIEANKASSGRSLIIAGSKKYPGAALLCGRAASRVGSGYIYMLSESFKWIIHQPEFIPLKSFTQIKKNLLSAVVIGPGLGQNLKAKSLLKSALKNYKHLPMVVDADALNLIAKSKSVKLSAQTVLTPHEGELARLLGVSSKWVHAHRLEAVKQAQKKFKCIVILKGHQTLVADAANVYQNTSGNAALAKAGSGDVLSGIIGGLMSQGLSSLEAALLGVYLHGTLSDHWLKNKKDILSLMPSDLIELIPAVLRRLRS